MSEEKPREFFLYRDWDEEFMVYDEESSLDWDHSFHVIERSYATKLEQEIVALKEVQSSLLRRIDLLESNRPADGVNYFRSECEKLRAQVKLLRVVVSRIWALAKHDDKMIEAVCKEVLAATESETNKGEKE